MAAANKTVSADAAALPDGRLDLHCPRCGGGFECGASAGHCDCFGVRLTDALRAGLAARYPGRCLCLRCLRELIDADGQRPVTGAADASA